MFDMKKVGKKIAELRKANNMTQMELADIMDISFQAVSNWERGNSTPDISKLPELSNLFGVSIDEILGVSSPLLKSAAEGNVDKFLAENKVTAEEVKEVAPLLKPNQLDSIMEAVPLNTVRDSREVLPLVSDKAVNNITQKSVEEDDRETLEILSMYASGDVLNQIAVKWVSEGKDISSFVEYLAIDVIDDIALSSFKQGGVKAIESFAEYISEDCIDHIAKEAVKKIGVWAIEPIADYISTDCIDEIAREAVKTGGVNAIESILDYVSEDCINEIAKETIKKYGIKAAAPIMEYVSEDAISEFLRKKYL